MLGEQEMLVGRRGTLWFRRGGLGAWLEWGHQFPPFRNLTKSLGSGKRQRVQGVRVLSFFMRGVSGEVIPT